MYCPFYKLPTYIPIPLSESVLDCWCHAHKHTFDVFLNNYFDKAIIIQVFILQNAKFCYFEFLGYIVMNIVM